MFLLSVLYTFVCCHFLHTSEEEDGYRDTDWCGWKPSVIIKYKSHIHALWGRRILKWGWSSWDQGDHGFHWRFSAFSGYYVGRVPVPTSGDNHTSSPLRWSRSLRISLSDQGRYTCYFVRSQEDGECCLHWHQTSLSWRNSWEALPC